MYIVIFLCTFICNSVMIVIVIMMVFFSSKKRNLILYETPVVDNKYMK